MVAMASASKRPPAVVITLEDDYSECEPSPKRSSSTKPKLIGRTISYGSMTVLSALAKAHPGVFDKHSDTEVSCSAILPEISIRRGGTKDALRHCTTEKHRKNVEGNKKQNSLFDTFDVEGTSCKSKQQLEAEVMLCQLLASKNISFISSTEISE